MASWLYPEYESNKNFFNVTFQNAPKATNLEDLATRMGEKDFRIRYKRNLINWLNPDHVFKELSRLGINTVRLPIPEDMMLPLDQGIKSYKTTKAGIDTNFMARCYQDALPVLTSAFNAADTYNIGIYVSNIARPGSGNLDIENWLLGVKVFLR